MSTIQQLELLKALINTYFSEELQLDETPAGAKRRLEIRQAVLDLSKN